MNKVLKASILLGVAMACCSAAAWAHTSRRNIVAGIDVDAVPWAEFCAGIQPITVSRGGVTCSNVHPTSTVVRRYVDFSGVERNAPSLKCHLLAKEFARYTTPQGQSNWSQCRSAWIGALHYRAPGSSIAYDDMTLEAFAKKYFAPWLVSGAPK